MQMSQDNLWSSYGKALQSQWSEPNGYEEAYIEEKAIQIIPEANPVNKLISIPRDGLMSWGEDPCGTTTYQIGS